MDYTNLTFTFLHALTFYKGEVFVPLQTAYRVILSFREVSGLLPLFFILTSNAKWSSARVS
jgi:hypothetical protein